MTQERFQKIKKVLDKRQPDLTLIMDQVHKPHNLAAIIRSCDAMGLCNVYGISNSKKNINTQLKAASGSNHWVKFYIQKNLNSLYYNLKKEGHTLYLANRSSKAMNFREVDYTKPSTIILGSELDGVSKEAFQLADYEIMIPMYGMVDSLNVSVANALILFEIQRQREKSGFYKKRRLPIEEYQRLLFEFSYPKIASVYRKKGKSYPSLDSEGQIII